MRTITVSEDTESRRSYRVQFEGGSALTGSPAARLRACPLASPALDCAMCRLSEAVECDISDERYPEHKCLETPCDLIYCRPLIDVSRILAALRGESGVHLILDLIHGDGSSMRLAYDCEVSRPVWRIETRDPGGFTLSRSEYQQWTDDDLVLDMKCYLNCLFPDFGVAL